MALAYCYIQLVYCWLQFYHYRPVFVHCIGRGAIIMHDINVYSELTTATRCTIEYYTGASDANALLR